MTLRFRTQDTRASTARKLNALLVGESDAGPFFRFRETPQTYDQWELELESVRRALADAYYDVSAIGQFRNSDTRQLRCLKLNRMVSAIAAGDQDTAPTNLTVPVITGEAVVGEALSASDGTWRGNPTPTVAYQWKRDGADIAAATSATYTLVEADEAAMVTVTVTATNSAGNASATSSAVGPVEPEAEAG